MLSNEECREQEEFNRIIDRLVAREEAAICGGRMTSETKPGWAPMAGIKDSGERVTFKSGAMRDPSTGKIKWSRITFGPMMRRWAQHLTNAEVKYPDPVVGLPNFSLIEGREELVRYKESAYRHFMSWFHGETDEDHAAAVFFNINGVEIIKDKACAKGQDIDDPFRKEQS